MATNGHVFARPRRGTVLAAVLCLAIALALAAGTGRAAAAPQIAVLGAAAPATPSCPEGCQAIGKTTGFQTTIGKTVSPFAAPYRGKVVAWSIKLSRPTSGADSQTSFFNDFFGGPPSARISILKPINKKIKKGKPIYRLKAQSPVEELTPFLGTTTTFQLKQPLTVKPGQIVALTVPTWAPAFAINQGGKTAWQASRKRGKCNKASDIRLGRPHLAAGTNRAYGCVYKTARLLYSATVVKDPNAPAPKPPKKKQ